MVELIKRMPIPGTAAQFNAGMECLANRLGGLWTSAPLTMWTGEGGLWTTPRGTQLYFRKYQPITTPADQCRASWQVGLLLPPGAISGRVAGIEVYEEASATRVDFLDGYMVGQRERLMLPIGSPFEDFADWVCSELAPPPKVALGGAAPQADSHAVVLPKSAAKRVEWQEIYGVITQLREEYQEKYENGDTEDPGPSIADIIDTVKSQFGRRLSERTIGKIKKAGDQGLLDQPN